MVTRTLSLTYGATTINLDDPDTLAGSGMAGTGMAPVDVQWLSGAGSGSVHRGSRVLPREIDLPIHLAGESAADVRDALDDLDYILDPSHAPATLTVTFTDSVGPTVTAWSISVVRTDGGDWVWGEDTTGGAWLSTEVTLTAGNPYWTRTTAATVATMTVGTSTVVNPGTAEVWPTWTITGPCTGCTLTGPSGVLAWSGSLTAGQTVTVDTFAATIKQGATNVYAGLAAAPRFWPLPPGSSSVTVAVAGSGVGTNVALSYYPRKGLMF